MGQIKYIFYSSLVLLTLESYGQKLPIIEVHALNFTRYNSPIYVALNRPLNLGANYQIQNLKSGRVTSIQELANNGLIFMLPDTLRPHEVARYRLIKTTDNRPHPVQLKLSEKGIQFEVNEKPALFYHTKTEQPPPGNLEYYARSGFIHPV